MMLELMAELTERLKNAASVVVLGIGSELKGDDAAGLLVVEKLSKFQHPKLKVLSGGSAPENLTGEIKKLKPSHLIMADAASIGRPPGEIQLLTPAQIGGISFSTHALPLKVMIGFILEDHPCEVLIIAIQPKHLSFGAEVSPEVKEAAKITAEAIYSALA